MSEPESPDSTVEPKPESKPALKPESRPEPKPESRPKLKPESSPEPSLPVRAFHRLGVVGAPALGAAALATLFDGAWRIIDFGGMKVVAGLLHGALLFGLLGLVRVTGTPAGVRLPESPARSRLLGAVSGLFAGLVGALVFYLSFSILRWEERASPELFLVSVLLAWVTVWLGLGLSSVQRGKLGQALLGGVIAGLISIPGIAVIALIWTGLLRSFPTPLQVALELPAWWLCFTPALAVLSAPGSTGSGAEGDSRHDSQSGDRS